MWEKICEFIHQDHYQTIHLLSHTVGISYEVCQEILMEKLNMHHHAAVKFAPQLLTLNQKQLCPDTTWPLSIVKWLTMTQLSSLVSSRTMKFGLWLRSRDKTTVAVEEPVVTMM